MKYSKKLEMMSCYYFGSKYILGAILWLAAAAALIIAWMNIGNPAGVLGMDATGWLLTALVLGVLAIPCLSRGGYGMRGMHGEGCGCGVCK